MDCDVLSDYDVTDMLHRKYNRKNGVYVDQFKDHPFIDLRTDYDKSPAMVLMRMHARYLDDCNDKKLVLEHEEKGYYIRPYVVRGCLEYDEKTSNRMLNIRDDWDRRPNRDLAMMITISPRAVGSMWCVHKQIKYWWPAFMDWMRHRFTFSRYVWAMEPTKRHYSHYHLVIQGRHPKGLLAQEILSWWQRHGLDIEDPGVDVQYARGDPCNYALKYVTKGCQDQLWSAVLWLSGGRIWGVSRGLGRDGGKNNSESLSDGKWVFLGSIPKIYIRSLLDGEILIEDIRELERLRRAGNEPD